MKETDLAYIAGFFDGDGCVSLQLPPHYALGVVIVQKRNLPLFSELQKEYGGTIYQARTGSWRWYAYSSSALRFLKDILPFLRIKNRQARLAILFQSIRQSRGHRTEKLTDEELAWRKEVADLISALKKNPAMEVDMQRLEAQGERLKRKRT